MHKMSDQPTNNKPPGPKVVLASLRKENEKLKRVISEIWWMAQRYANDRNTYAPTLYNEAIDIAIKNGWKIPQGQSDNHPLYADDGCLGKWVPERQRFEKEITRTELPIVHSADTNDKT
jgi:hypothetical protein